MRMGCHSHDLPAAITDADLVWWYESEVDSVLEALFVANDKVVVRNSIPLIIQQVVAQAQAGDEIVIMSNGGFGGIHTMLINSLGMHEEP